jgi:hypothetical protein
MQQSFVAHYFDDCNLSLSADVPGKMSRTKRIALSGWYSSREDAEGMD